MTEHDPEFPYVIKDFSGHVFAKFHKREQSLAKWFAENHPHYKKVINTTPKSPAEIAFDAIEIGQHFGFYYEHETKRERFPYTKVSKTTYEARYPEPWHEGTLTIKPASGLLPFAQPKPTLREQFDALPVGTVFTGNWGGTQHRAVKISDEKFFNVGIVSTASHFDWGFAGDLEVIPVD